MNRMKHSVFCLFWGLFSQWSTATSMLDEDDDPGFLYCILHCGQETKSDYARINGLQIVTLPGFWEEDGKGSFVFRTMYPKAAKARCDWHKAERSAQLKKSRFGSILFEERECWMEAKVKGVFGFRSYPIVSETLRGNRENGL